jgi:hypothetical protein
MMNELETKTINKVMDAILAKPATDSGSLRCKQSKLRDELRESVSNGNGDAIIRLQRELESYDLLVKAAEISETKAALNDVENSFAEIQDDVDALYTLRKEKADDLVPLLDAYNDAKTELQQIEFAIALAADKKLGAIEKRRELRAKLSNFLKEVEYGFETVK